MIWTRRGFLQTVLAAIGTAAIAPAIRFGEAIAPSAPIAVLPPVFDPGQPYSVYELIACVSGDTAAADTPVLLDLTRRGQSVLRAAMHPRSTFRWVAVPGGELADGTTLSNDSSADLDVQFAVIQNGHRWWIADGQATWFGSPTEPTQDDFDAYDYELAAELADS